MTDDDQMEIGTLLDPVDPVDPVDPGVPGIQGTPAVSDRRVETIARFLAGFRFPDRHSYEKLTTAQRKTALAAAAAAVAVLNNHTD